MNDRTLGLSFFNYGRSAKFILVLIVLILQLLSSIFVYAMGGTRYGYLHIIYLPIFLGGVFFRVRGGFAFGVIGALLLGPFMPEDVSTQTIQHQTSWLMRGFFFCLMGSFAGVVSQTFSLYLKNIQAQLTTDSVTGLLNSAGLNQVLKDRVLSDPVLHTFQKRKKTEIHQSTSYGVLVILVTPLNDIDKAFGSQATATLLRDITQRLNSCLTQETPLFYVDYATFAILFPTSELLSFQLKHLCQEKLGNRFSIEKTPIFLEFHFGEARQETPKDTSFTLIRRAKMAANKFMDMNQFTARFLDQDEEIIKRNLVLIHDLNDALENNDLTVVYQPKIHLASGECCDFEALVRWTHPIFGVISPAEFIPMIEKTLLINHFTKWLMETTFRHLQQWHQQEFKVKCGLNFSMRNLEDPLLFRELFRLKEQYQLPPSSLEIEVTETAISRNLDQVAEVLSRLRQEDIKIAIDDFGTGQASLQYLFKLPVDSLKIDQMFIRAMMTNPAAESIVRSAIILGHDLGLQVIAEGVETREEYIKLKTLECDYAQGYYCGYPMSYEKATSWMISYKQDQSNLPFESRFLL